MKSFLLDKCPNFGEEKVSLDGNQYLLKQIKGNGCHLSVIDIASGLERDNVSFSKSDLKALFLLLSTEK
jgi:hypothetical protein